MTTTSNLPVQVRKRIERLESTVSKLESKVSYLVSQIQGKGLDVQRKRASPRAQKIGTTIETARKFPLTVQRTAEKETLASATGGLAAAVARGEAAKVEWVNSGEVVPAKKLASQWGLTPQALGPATKRGEIFAIVVKRERFYPGEFLTLDRDAISVVSKALGSLSPAEKLIFWKRRHGDLGGKTVPEVLTAGQLERAAQLAQAWAAEAHAGSDDDRLFVRIKNKPVLESKGMLKPPQGKHVTIEDMKSDDGKNLTTGWK